MMKKWRISTGPSDEKPLQKYTKEEGASIVLKNKKESIIQWIDISNCDEHDMYQLQAIFPEIHPLSLEDVIEENNREKYEDYYHYCFLSLRGHSNNSNIYVFLLKIAVVTIHNGSHKYFDHVLARMNRQNQPYGYWEPKWIAYSMIDVMVDEMMCFIQMAEMEIDSIEDLVLFFTESDQTDMLLRISKARKRVIRLKRLLTPKTEILNRLKPSNPNSQDRLVPYIRDALDHISNMQLRLEQQDETLTRSHSNYLAKINIDLAMVSNKMNEVVKKLTVYATVFLPLTLFSGIMGMNVPVPGQDGVTWKMLGPFSLILLVMIAFTAILVHIASKAGWF